MWLNCERHFLGVKSETSWSVTDNLHTCFIIISIVFASTCSHSIVIHDLSHVNQPDTVYSRQSRSCLLNIDFLLTTLLSGTNVERFAISIITSLISESFYYTKDVMIPERWDRMSLTSIKFCSSLTFVISLLCCAQVVSPCDHVTLVYHFTFSMGNIVLSLRHRRVGISEV